MCDHAGSPALSWAGAVAARAVAWMGLSAAGAIFYCSCFDISVAGFNDVFFWSGKKYINI